MAISIAITTQLRADFGVLFWALKSNRMRVIQERNASNVPTVSYTRGSDLSVSLEGAGGIGGWIKIGVGPEWRLDKA